MKKLKYVKLFESFGRLYESVDENYVVKPYEFKIVRGEHAISRPDFEKEYEYDKDDSGYMTSKKRPPQSEVDEFESYLDSRVEDKSSYGNEDTFKEIIQYLLETSMEEMFKTKKPMCGTDFWEIEFFSNVCCANLYKNEEQIREVAEFFMSNFSTDSKLERDMDAYRGGYEDQDSGSYSGTTYFKGKKVFSWSSGRDGYGFGGGVDNVEMLYKGIKDYLTMILYM
jgi:hypothetical protein